MNSTLFPSEKHSHRIAAIASKVLAAADYQIWSKSPGDRAVVWENAALNLQ